MSIGAGIGIAGIWISSAAMVALFNSRISTTKESLSPIGAIVIAVIACGATYYVAGIH